MNNQQQTPLERLISDKERVLSQCRQKEQKLNDDFSYIQENAGTLLLSGLSSILFNSKHDKADSDLMKAKPSPANEQQTLSLGFTDYLTIAKSMMPIAWDIVQPILVSWGINRAKRWVTKLLFKKKR